MSQQTERKTLASVPALVSGLVPAAGKLVMFGGKRTDGEVARIDSFFHDRLCVSIKLAAGSAHTNVQISVEGTDANDPSSAADSEWVSLLGAELGSWIKMAELSTATPADGVQPDGIRVPRAFAEAGLTGFFSQKWTGIRVGVAGDGAAGGSCVIRAQVTKEVV